MKRKYKHRPDQHVLKVGRRPLQAQYERLREALADILALIGQPIGKGRWGRDMTHWLPPLLGHWTQTHSERLASYPELAPWLERIEELRAARDPERIKAQHPKFIPGGNFRRKNIGGYKERVQTNPGHWPPEFKYVRRLS